MRIPIRNRGPSPCGEVPVRMAMRPLDGGPSGSLRYFLVMFHITGTGPGSQPLMLSLR